MTIKITEIIFDLLTKKLSRSKTFEIENLEKNEKCWKSSFEKHWKWVFLMDEQ